MIAELTKALKLFYCYAREDKALRDELEMHLSGLKRQGLITTWYDREISPGTEWELEIDTHLNTAHIILLLVSPPFMASDYCYGIEMKRALELHEAGTARVIPIVLHPVYWEDAPFSKLQILPEDAFPVTRWPDRGDAFLDITWNIQKAIKELLVSLKTREWLNEANNLTNLKRYEKALAACEQAIHLDSNLALAYSCKGYALYHLKRYEEALAAYEQAIHLDPNLAFAYSCKGAALNGLKRYKEALAAYEQAIHLDPNLARAYNNKGVALRNLKRYEEALAAYEQAIRLDPNLARAYNNKGYALYGLKRYEEALAAYEQAIHLNPNLALDYGNKGNALYGLKCYEEALAAYEQAIHLDPNLALAYNNKGCALEMLGREEEAQKAYQRARELGYQD